MNNRIKNGVALTLIPQILMVKWLGMHPEWVELYYSNSLYPLFSRFFRTMLGWIPFSVGDLAYISLLILGLRYLYIRRKRIHTETLSILRDIFMVCAVAYFTFHLLWGLNYYRMPLSEKMGLDASIDRTELVSFIERLTVHTNALQLRIAGDSTQAVHIPYSQPEVFEKTLEGYQSLGQRFPYLRYEVPSIKTSLFSTALSYMGYGGYLNPFTQEAQVNAKLPSFRFPVVSGHEIGHQLGYSSESETNLIGFLVTAQNKDPYFQYSAYAYALGYCLIQVKALDETEFNRLYGQLNPGIKKNYAEMERFWETYTNPLEPLFKSAFDTFLKANNQTEGILSYRSVVPLMVAYYRDHNF